MEDAQRLIKRILSATENTIETVKAEIYADDRIVPYLTKKELVKANTAFAALSLASKKKALICLINKNKLYVNYSDMDDTTYAVSKEDKAFSHSFYEEV